MKKRIIAAVLAVLMISTLLLPLSVGAASVNHMSATFGNERAKLATMTYVMTSDDPEKAGKGDGILELYADYDSGEIAVKNTVTGEITLSNPYNITSIFQSTNTTDKGKFLSQAYIKYFKLSEGSNAMKTWYSYNECFAYKQGSVVPTENGLTVNYSIGEEERDYAVPLKISLEDFYNALRTAGKDDRSIELLVKEYFSSYDPDQKYIKDPLLSDPTSTKRETMIKEQPLCATTPFMFLLPNVYQNTNTMKNLEQKLVAAAPEYFVLSKEGEEKTQFELDRDKYWNEEADRGMYPEKEYPNFKFTVDYKLTNDGLVVELDTKTIEYNKDLYCLAEITLLPYFGAASLNPELDEKGNTQYDNGYIFIPDGSGAIVRFEDLIAKNQTGKISSILYGSDYAKYQITGKNTEQYTMPVFGLINSSEDNGTGYFAIIEEGDAMGSIVADAERYYISAYASFKYADYDVYDLADAFSSGTSSSTEITVVSDNCYEGKYRVNYKFLTAEETAKQYDLKNTYDTSYVGMAKLYRDYLTANGTIKKITETEENTKLFLEVFGSVKVKEQVFSFPVTVNKELTTFSDIINMQKELADAGIDNSSYILKGFYNGGLASTYPTKIKWQKVLGGEKGLNALLADSEMNNYDVSLDVDFSYSHGSKWFSGYSSSKHATKTIDDRYTTRRTYYAATQTFERTSGVAVSSASFISLFEKFTKSISDVSLKSLAIRALGKDLNSDFDKDDFYSREDSKNNTVKFMESITRLNERKFGLIIDAGNVYAMKYASGVLSAPLDSSKYIRASESVPFYGMVYHGSVEFAGNALNMEGDQDYMFLKAIENGAVLYYTLAKQNVETLKSDPEYSKYYSISYDFLKGSIAENYTTYNNAMKDKQNKFIVDHKFLNDGEENCSVTLLDGTAVDNSLVVLVVYEGGEGFILNYNSQDVIVEFEGKEYIVPGLDFKPYKS